MCLYFAVCVIFLSIIILIQYITMAISSEVRSGLIYIGETSLLEASKEF